MTPAVRVMPVVVARMQRPAGTYIVELPGGRLVSAIDEEHVRRVVRAQAPGSSIRWE